MKLKLVVIMLFISTTITLTGQNLEDQAKGSKAQNEAGKKRHTPYA